jgi:ElaB/YqjD/DUF883 family membrane-anchored ribosome-binding protein
MRIEEYHGMDTLTQKPSATAGGATPLNSGSVDHEIETLKSDVAELVAAVANVAKTGFADAQSAAVGKTNELAHSIKHNPMQATLISIGIGFVVGLLITR